MRRDAPEGGTTQGVGRELVPRINARLSRFLKTPVANDSVARGQSHRCTNAEPPGAGPCGVREAARGRKRQPTGIHQQRRQVVNPSPLAKSRLHPISSRSFSNSNWIVFILVARDFPESVLIRRRAKTRAVATLRHSLLPTNRSIIDRLQITWLAELLLHRQRVSLAQTTLLCL